MSGCCQCGSNDNSLDTSCPRCGRKGRAVGRVTLLSLLKPEVQARLGPSQYFYCPAAGCEVVYFSNQDALHFLKADVSVRVGQKEREDPILVCYCFSHTRDSICEEIQRTRNSTIQAEITAKVKAGLCRCQETNPQGSCCLGNVARLVRSCLNKYGDTR